jgi:RND family efflux transporter MFP subunit
MSKTIGILLLFALFLSGFSACSQTSPGQDKKAPAGRPPVAVDIAAVSSAAVTEGIEVVGSLAPKFQSEIKSEYAGIVTEVYVTEWVQVSKGTLLAQLDTREANILRQKAEAGLGAARAGLLQAEVALTRAEREYQRFLKMKEAGLVTPQALDEARSARDASQAALQAGKAQIAVAEEDLLYIKTRLEKATIRAPMDGVVAFRGVNVGDLAGEMGMPKIMFLIVDNRVMNLTLTVPSTRLSRLRPGQTLRFHSDAVPSKEFQGKVLFINPSLSESDRSARVVVEVPNKDGVLKGGMFVKGIIETSRREGVVQVPRPAIFNWDVANGKGQVFLANGSLAQIRLVSLGEQDGDFVEVTSGLTAGEKVVVRGGFNLKDGDRLNITGTKGE